MERLALIRTQQTQEVFNSFRVGDRVLFSGTSNYSYFEGVEEKTHRNKQKNELGTIVSRSDVNITIKLDKIEGKHRPHRFVSSLPELNGVDVLPMEHYAVIGIGDFFSGDKKIKLA